MQVVSWDVSGCFFAEHLLLLKPLNFLVSKLGIEQHRLHLLLKLSPMRFLLIIAIRILSLCSAKRIHTETTNIIDQHPQSFLLPTQDNPNKVIDSQTDILPHLHHIQLVDIALIVNPERAFYGVTVREAQPVVEDRTGAVFLLVADLEAALVELEVGVGLAQHVGEETAVEEVLGLGEQWRAVGESVGLRGMAMEIDEHLDLFVLLFLVLFEVPDDAHEFWEEMVAKGLLIDVPIPVEIMPQHSSPIVTHLDPVNIDHWYDDPEYLTVYLLQLVQKALHHPTAHTLARMLSGHHHHCGLAVPLFVHQQGVNLVAQHCLCQFYLFEWQRKEKGGQSQVCVGRLAAKFYLIVGMREVIVEFQAILNLSFFCFFLLVNDIA